MPTGKTKRTLTIFAPTIFPIANPASCFINETIETEFTLAGAGATNAQRGYSTGFALVFRGTGTGAVDSTLAQTVTIDLDLGTDGDEWTCDFMEASIYQ